MLKQNVFLKFVKLCSLCARGLVPSVVEIMYLDKVKWLEMYGVDLHPVKVGSDLGGP